MKRSGGKAEVLEKKWQWGKTSHFNPAKDASWILTGLMFNISPPIGTFLLHKWMCPAMHGMLHRAPSSLIKVVSQQAESCIQALQIDMGDLTLLCTAKRVRVDSKRSNQEACCTGLYQD